MEKQAQAPLEAGMLGGGVLKGRPGSPGPQARGQSAPPASRSARGSGRVGHSGEPEPGGKDWVRVLGRYVQPCVFFISLPRAYTVRSPCFRLFFKIRALFSLLLIKVTHSFTFGGILYLERR